MGWICSEHWRNIAGGSLVDIVTVWPRCVCSMRVGKRTVLAGTFTLLLSFWLWTRSYESTKVSLTRTRVRNVYVGEIPNHDNMTSPKESHLTSKTAEVEKICDKLVPSKVPTPELIMINREHKLAYCYIPKCGCTFWKRVMRFLNKDYKGENITSPFQISRLEAHLPNPDTFVQFKEYKDMSILFTSFMFVRDPYARLWSAYVDKFYLPDFWVDPKTASGRNSKASKCFSDISFHDFTNIVLTSSEPHWNPMHEVCDPCSYKPSIIGRVESFSSDSRSILKQANLSWILQDYDHVTHVEDELTSLIHYNLWNLPRSMTFMSKCISKVGLMKRLWNVFQINGYIPTEVSLPAVDQTTTVAEFTNIVLDQHRRRPNTPDVWRKQRKEFMIAAYKSVPVATLNKLRGKYEKDFSLFNYDPTPVEIFGNRKTDNYAS